MIFDSNQKNHTAIAFTPIRLRKLRLKNRFIKSATYEGMCRNGIPTDQLIDFHTRIAEGGIGMSTVAYGAVNNIGRTHSEQMFLQDSVLSSLKKLTTSIHQSFSAASIQLTHCGYFSRNNQIRGQKPLSSTRRLNKYGIMEGLFFSKSMSELEIKQTAEDFAHAARLSKTAGFDAVEIHMGHGYLISQFLSPGINSRKDKYGGSLKNRLRFPVLVLEKIRDEVGQDFPILCKINLDDGFYGGLQLRESIEVARILEKTGADALVLSGGYTSKTPFYLMRGEIPLSQMIKVEKKHMQKIALAFFGKLMIKKYPFEENFFLPQARKVRQSVNLPIVYLGGVVSAEGVKQIFNEGFDMIAIGRALIHDPDFIKKVQSNGNHVSECNHCNECVAEMDNAGVKCVIIDQ